MATDGAVSFKDAAGTTQQHDSRVNADGSLRPSVSFGWGETTYTVARGPASGTAPVAPAAPAAVANTDKILLTGYHLSTSTKTVRIKKITVSALLGTAVTYLYSVYRTSATTPTGGTAVASRSHNAASAASDTVWMYQNTVAIATALVDGSIVDVAMVSAIGGHGPVILYEFKPGAECEELIIRPGVAEGYAICSRTTTATAPDAIILVEYTEE